MRMTGSGLHKNALSGLRFFNFFICYKNSGEFKIVAIHLFAVFGGMPPTVIPPAGGNTAVFHLAAVPGYI